MNLTGLKRGDVIAVNRAGFKFMAFVDDADARPLAITPIDRRNNSYRSCRAREVIGIWRRSKNTEDPRAKAQVTTDATG